MFESLRNKPEIYRKKVAFAITIGIFSFILLIWASYRNLIDFGGGNNSGAMATNNSEIKSISPIQSVSKSFGRMFDEFGNEFNAVKESVGSVFVPFITGIEIYDSR